MTPLVYTKTSGIGGYDRYLLTGPAGIVDLWLGPVPDLIWHHRQPPASGGADRVPCDLLEGGYCWADGSSRHARRLADLPDTELRVALEVAYRQVWSWVAGEVAP